jgi:hypothetical protein
VGLVRWLLTKDPDRPAKVKDAEAAIRGYLRKHEGQATGGPSSRASRRASPRRPPRGCSKEAAASRLVVPSPYFLNRGFSPRALEEFGVGDHRSGDPKDPFYRRAGVVEHGGDGERVVGGTGRSVFERCAACRVFHDPAEGCPEAKWRPLPRFAKWWHNRGLEISAALYNWHRAKLNLQACGGVVLVVEGPGCVWRLHEAGVFNAVATFGAELHAAQEALLAAAGARHVVLLYDRDEAGSAGAGKAAKGGSWTYRREMPAHDVGSLSVEQVRHWLLPAVEEALGFSVLGPRRARLAPQIDAPPPRPAEEPEAGLGAPACDDEPLHGFDEAAAAIDACDTVVLVEDAAVAARLRRAGVPNAVALGGLTLTARQERQLSGLAFGAVLLLPAEAAEYLSGRLPQPYVYRAELPGDLARATDEELVAAVTASDGWCDEPRPSGDVGKMSVEEAVR